MGNRQVKKENRFVYNSKVQCKINESLLGHPSHYQKEVPKLLRQ